jgi:signal transduction histidine kinase/CheY-like chemotaxis protein
MIPKPSMTPEVRITGGRSLPGNQMRPGAPAAIERTLAVCFASLACVLGVIAWAMTAASMPPLIIAGAIAVVYAAVGLFFARTMSGRIVTIFIDPLEQVYQRANALGIETATPLVRPSDLVKGCKILDASIGQILSGVTARFVELEKARESANAENVAKSQFLANMSHELRTPLNAILGYAMLLQEDASDAGNGEVVADLDRILKAGRHLLTLINDVLDLSRIEADRSTIERSVIDIAALVRGACTSFERTEHRNGNEFTVHVASDAAIMIGDQTKMRQCLINLLNNAFKFTANGKVNLDVRIDSETSVVFSISDTGVGIDEDKLPNIFESFRQEDNSASRTFGGTGLGLAITRRLARLMGGTITVSSQKSKGSTFILSLPINPLGTAEPRRLATDTGQLTEVRYNGEDDQRLALIIDDNEAANDLMSRWLARLGYRTITTVDGERGVELARTEQPDLILLDVILPGRSGYEILEELRNDADVGMTPIILVTIDDDRARALNAGASEYLRKPLAESDLREVLEIYGAKIVGDILIVEDDEDAGDLVQRCAEQVGLTVRRAVNGKQGLDMARERIPSAIVLDLSMPECDGLEVIRQLTADDRLRAVPVIVLSACEITLEDHRTIENAGYHFRPKGQSSPREIAMQLKSMVGK